jgi:ketosteroid isomerase-like protein
MDKNYQDRLDSVRQRISLLHTAQKVFYAGGSADLLHSVLTHDVVWSVPGRNAIAGRYEGIENVIAYFARRRDMAARTLSMQTHDILVGQGDFVAAVTDGRATLNGVQRQWSTVGVYQLRDDRVAACWLLPLDFDVFDRIWQAPTRISGQENVTPATLPPHPAPKAANPEDDPF